MERDLEPSSTFRTRRPTAFNTSPYRQLGDLCPGQGLRLQGALLRTDLHHGRYQVRARVCDGPAPRDRGPRRACMRGWCEQGACERGILRERHGGPQSHLPALFLPHQSRHLHEMSAAGASRWEDWHNGDDSGARPSGHRCAPPTLPPSCLQHKLHNPSHPLLSLARRRTEIPWNMNGAAHMQPRRHQRT